MNTVQPTFVILYTDDNGQKHEAVFLTRRSAVTHLNHLILDRWFTDARLVRRQGKTLEPVSTSFQNLPTLRRGK